MKPCVAAEDPAATSSPAVIRMRIRVEVGRERVLGPGRAELLARIRLTHSIAHAAREMGMSYMKAWSMVRSMNAGFREPLVMRRRGGVAGGEARLTAWGERALALYERMDRQARAAVRDTEAELAALLRG